MSTSYRIYANGGTGGPIDYSTVVATVTGTTYTPAALAPGSSWAFAVRAFDAASGLEEPNTDCRVAVNLDASGNDVTATPTPATITGLTPRPGGSLRVDWIQWSIPPASKPTSFAVYATPGTTVNTAAGPGATTTSRGSARQFSATITGLTPGTSYAVLVRSTAGTLHSDSVAMTVVLPIPPAAVASLSATPTT